MRMADMATNFCMIIRDLMGEMGVEYLVHRLSTKIKCQSNKIETNLLVFNNGAVNPPDGQAVLIQRIWV